MLQNKQGRFFTAQEKYQILEDLEKWMEETGSKNTMRFARERGLSPGALYRWIAWKKAGVPLEDSVPRTFIKNDPRIDAGHAQAARNRAIKGGAVNPAHQHLKPTANYEEKLEAGRERARQYRERERARKLAEMGAARAAENPLASQRGTWPDETTRTYWAQALLRARVLGRNEVKRVKANFASQTGLFPDTVNVWARRYIDSDVGKSYLDSLYAGRGTAHHTPAPGTFPDPPAPAPKPVGNGTSKHEKPSPVRVEVKGGDFQPLANAVESFAKALGELGARFTMLDGRVSAMISEHQGLTEEVHLGTSNLSKILRALDELTPYFK